MIAASPIPSLNCQQLTPAKLRWIMDVSERTVAEWIADSAISHFHKGRVVRFSPEAVSQFIADWTRVGRNNGSPLTVRELLDSELFWRRNERLFRLVVMSELRKVAILDWRDALTAIQKVDPS